MTWLGWAGVLLVALGVWLARAGVRGNERLRERAGWRPMTGRITDEQVDRIPDETGARQIRVYVEYTGEDGVIVGFWNLGTVSDRQPFGGKVDIRVNPANRYQGEITSRPFRASPPPTTGPPWVTGVVVAIVGLGMLILAFVL